MISDATKEKRARFVRINFVSILHYEDEKYGIQIFKTEDKSRIACFSGRKFIPDVFCSKRTPEDFDMAVGQFISAVNEIHAEKIERQKLASKAQNNVNVGDVFVCSWGYDQTNVDYYQVVEKVGKVTIKVRRIGAETVEQGRGCGRSVPIPDHFIDDKIDKRRISSHGFSVSSYASAFPLAYDMVDGEKVYKSSFFSHWR